MSKASKSRSKQKHKQEKRAKKQAQKALYASYRDAGITRHSTRAKRAAIVNRKVRTARHRLGTCNNTGCMECHGVNFAPFIDKNGVPRHMPQWMYKMWQDNING